MNLSSLHILFTYQCTFECDHCFVWGSPFQSGTLTLTQIQLILEQANVANVEWIYFEGGEPFLYYPVVLKGVQMAKQMGFHIGIVSNAYWAITVEDAIEWLRPLSDLIEDLTVSSDLYHYSEMMSRQAQNAQEAARVLGIPLGIISVCQPETINAAPTNGQIPVGDGAAVMYRGRAVTKLATRAAHQPWEKFVECPHEDLREPGRCHLDPLGNLHICQGISLGNIFETSLKEICEKYNAETHPICGPLLAGGPTELVSQYNLPHENGYADACHLCYEARLGMRARFPEILKPDQMYGCMGSFH